MDDILTHLQVYLMEDEAVTPFQIEKRGRGMVVAEPENYFFTTLKKPLLRVRGVMEAFPDASADASFSSLADLESFSSVRSLDEVFEKLGGRASRASAMLLSVIDEDEKKFLERNDGRGREKLIRERVRGFIMRAHFLASQLPSKDKDPLIKQVQVLKFADAEDDDDEEDEEEDEEEEEEPEEPSKTKKQKLSRAAKNKADGKSNAQVKKTEPPKKKERRSKVQGVESPVAKKRSKKDTEEVVSDKGKEELNGDVEQDEEEEQEVDEEVYEKEIKKVTGISADDVATLLEEAEKEFQAIRKLNIGEGVQDARWESAPNVKELIASASLGNLECLTAKDISALNSLDGRTSLHMWWRTAKRSCVIYGVFQLLRQRKAKNSKIEDRYDALEGEGLLSFGQASRYARIGKFLSDYPMFIFQRKWVTQADWFHIVDVGPKKKRGAVKLVDYLPSLLAVSSVFLKDTFSLHQQGFQVIPGLMKDYISEELIGVCAARCEESGEIVFNNAKDPEAAQNDKKRVQLSLDKIDGTINFKQALTKELSKLYPTHKVDSMVALLSKAYCKAQLTHTDYTPETLANAGNDDAKVPLACLVALTDGTLFDVWPGAIRFVNGAFKHLQLKLRAGDVLIFRGDLVHGGAAFEEANVRIHVYLDAEGILRPMAEEGVELTHFVPEMKRIKK